MKHTCEMKHLADAALRAEKADGGDLEDREDIRRVRNSCNNMLEFIYAQLSNRDLWRTVVAVVQLCMHCKRFESTHNKSNPSSEESTEWWASRADDLGMDHVEDSLSDLQDTELLQSLGCHVEGCSSFFLGLDADHPLVGAKTTPRAPSAPWVSRSFRGG